MDSKPRQRKATALRYNPDTQVSPEILASGQGLVADKIIQLAQESGLPIREDPMLAEALAGLQLADEIPPELYLAVAEALVWAWNTDQKLKNKP